MSFIQKRSAEKIQLYLMNLKFKKLQVQKVSPTRNNSILKAVSANPSNSKPSFLVDKLYKQHSSETYTLLPRSHLGQNTVSLRSRVEASILDLYFIPTVAKNRTIRKPLFEEHYADTKFRKSNSSSLRT